MEREESMKEAEKTAAKKQEEYKREKDGEVSIGLHGINSKVLVNV